MAFLVNPIVIAIVVYLYVGFSGFSFGGGWAFCVFWEFNIFIAYCLLYSINDTIRDYGQEKIKYRKLLETKRMVLEQNIRNQEAKKEFEAQRLKRVAKQTLDDLIEEGQRRRFAPAKAAQERAQRLAALEFQLEELFNRYRFAHDVTGSGDLHSLRQGFVKDLQAKSPFSVDDIALLSGSEKNEIKALLQKSNP
jgi:hypothetical protein